MSRDQETLIVFGPDGILQEVHRMRNPLGHTPSLLFQDSFPGWPARTRVGRFHDQDKLSGSQLGAFVGIAQANEDWNQIRVFPLERIRKRAELHAIMAAEISMIDLTKDIDSIAIVLSMIGSYRSASLADRYQKLLDRRYQAQRIVRREEHPEIVIDPLVANLAGECFYVDVDPMIDRSPRSPAVCPTSAQSASSTTRPTDPGN